MKPHLVLRSLPFAAIAVVALVDVLGRAIAGFPAAADGVFTSGPDLPMNQGIVDRFSGWG
jgi:hypothetical protein